MLLHRSAATSAATRLEDITRGAPAPITARDCECHCPQLIALFETLDRYQERIPLEVLQAALDGLDVSVPDLATSCCFANDHYMRNRLHLGTCYEALLVCWRPGQESPIHDHAGSSCAFRVLGGDADEVVFDQKKGVRSELRESEERQLPEGFVCVAQDADIHQVQNHRSGLDLVTLHIYSPALTRMHVYPPPSAAS